MQVHRELGPGFLESVYENALMIMFEENAIQAQAQVPLKVHFHGRIVGAYFADIIVENSVIIELKAQERMLQVQKAQTLNYLRAHGIDWHCFSTSEKLVSSPIASCLKKPKFV